MRAKNHKVGLDIFAKLLIILSFFIFGIGFCYDSNFNDEDVKKNNKNTKTQYEGPTVSITPTEGSDVVSDGSINEGDGNNDVIDSTSNDDVGDIGVTDNNAKINDNVIISSQGSKENDLNNINDMLRKEIEKKFSVTIKYGKETDGYTVANIGTVPIDNPSVVNNSLIRLNNVLGLYPNGFFDEISNGGIPLTIYLVNNYYEDNITGVTDSSYSYANISIAVKYPLEESFFHESYHYLERYMFKKGANFNTWNSINPEGFSYGTVYNDNSYSNTFSAESPFVNNYAQTDEKEDRASTFEYMMATSKASCLNNGQIVWKKAILMSRTIDAVFDTVSPDVIEYWERFLY